MRNHFEHEYSPAEWGVEELTGAFEEAAPPTSVPRRADRGAWDVIRSSDVAAPLVEEARESAETAAGESIPEITVSMIRRYADGDDVARSTYLSRYGTHRNRLTNFALAECLDDEGEYLDDVLDYAWELCEWTAWAHPGNVNYPSLLPRRKRLGP